jgi:hypothetical protein
MTNAIEKLMKTRVFRKFVWEAEAQELSEQAAKRRKWAAELRELRATREKRLAPLRAKHEKLEAARLPAEKAVQEARRLAREAYQEITALNNEIDRATQALEGELRASASDAFQEYRAELIETWELYRHYDENVFMIHPSPMTIEGRTVVSRFFFEAVVHVGEVMPLDADITDPLTAIAEHRQQLATQLAELVRRHDRLEPGKAADPLQEQRRQRCVLEKDLTFRRRRGWPEEALAEYRREQEKLLGLTPETVG